MHRDRTVSDTVAVGGMHLNSKVLSGPPAVLAALAVVAVVALLLGTLVYITDRDAGHAPLIPDLGLHVAGKVFGTLGQWLPSFVHPFSFSLLTAALLPCAAKARDGACVAWAAVDIAFEIGQHRQLSFFWADSLLAGDGGAPPIQALARYFVSGTFDAGDIIAVLSGAASAAVVLQILNPERKRHHES